MKNLQSGTVKRELQQPEKAVTMAVWWYPNWGLLSPKSKSAVRCSQEELHQENVVAVAVAGCASWGLLSPPMINLQPSVAKRELQPEKVSATVKEELQPEKAAAAAVVGCPNWGFSVRNRNLQSGAAKRKLQPGKVVAAAEADGTYQPPADHMHLTHVDPGCIGFCPRCHAESQPKKYRKIVVVHLMVTIWPYICAAVCSGNLFPVCGKINTVSHLHTFGDSAAADGAALPLVSLSVHGRMRRWMATAYVQAHLDEPE
ncbi:hypothetical protein DFH07DRAFT_777186 [Mycena maculata]|uniref:Uncharacterized protein n=1 Tax=Mycena maculata TaxID=230809 RepID=A0AAD7IJ27_9AGAR|nr:hypothetical protein DFH07DRAFT_777186 [Mycena maculata]